MAHADPERAKAYRKEYAKKYYQANRDRLIASAKEQFRRTPRQTVRDWHLRTRYGMTQADYDRMLAEQNGGCKTCGAPAESQQHGRLHVDHRHVDGKVRALLCGKCNRAVGLMDDNPDVADAIAALLRATH